MRSSFFNSLNGDRKYNAAHWAEYFSSFIGNGVFADPSSSMQVQHFGNMKIKIAAGACFINGYAGYADGADTLTLNFGGSGKRIDRIVIRLDMSARSIYPAIIEGTMASSPAAPAIVRDGTFYDIGIAEVEIGINAAEITQADITDTRSDSELCGWVKGLIEQIDTTAVFAQYEAQWELLRAACAQDEAAVIAAWDALNTVKTINGDEPVDGNISLDFDDLPSGTKYPKYTVQWGMVSSSNTDAVSVTFPKAFKSTPFIFLCGATKGSTSAHIETTSVTNTGFTATRGSYNNFYWVAFGDAVAAGDRE